MATRYRRSFFHLPPALKSLTALSRPWVRISVSAPATWYFALKAYNTSNVESSLSNIASKTIQ
jgi:hypothetical protein